MRYYYHRLLAALLACSITLLPLRFAQAQGECYVSDDSFRESETTCGTSEWNLGVMYGGGVHETEDPYADSYGACSGGYTNCTGIYQSQNVIQGNENFVDDGSDSFEQERVNWVLADWQVTFSSCNNSQHPTWEKQTINNYPFDTEDYDVFCG
jgi:hypothetical protein